MAAIGPLQLRTDALARLHREWLAVWSFALGTSLAAVVALAYSRGGSDAWQKPVVVVALAGLVALVVDLKRRGTLAGRYRVELTDDAIESWHEGGGPRRKVLKSELKSIVYATWPARGVVVKAVRGRGLFVPEGAERFNDLCLLLAKWKQIDESRTPRWIARAWPVVAVGAPALEVVAVGGPAPWMRALASVLLAAFGIVALVNALRSRRMTLRGRLLSTLLLVPVAWLLVNAWQALAP